MVLGHFTFDQHQPVFQEAEIMSFLDNFRNSLYLA